MPLNTGNIIHNRYKIIVKLGKGGFGSTYLAKDFQSTQDFQCVIKEIIPQSKSKKRWKKAVNRFIKEVKALKKLGKHSQIPTYYDYFIENDNFYLVQEFIQGITLAEELNQKVPLKEQELIELLREILELLEYVHRKKVIHRDIKPSNLIRRQSDKKIILIDFGAVKESSTLDIYDEDGEKTSIIGTPGYMAPEQQLGKPKANSDIYAVGIIGLQALTGLNWELFYSSENTGELVWRNFANVSDSLADVLDGMVRYDFRKRYQKAIDVLLDLSKSTSDIKFKVNIILKRIIYLIEFDQNNKFITKIGIILLLIIGGLITIKNILPKTCNIELVDDISCEE